MTRKALIEIDHQLEKLEFALAVSLTIVDQIKDKIKTIGFKYEEPVM